VKIRIEVQITAESFIDLSEAAAEHLDYVEKPDTVFLYPSFFAQVATLRSNG